MAKVSKIDPKTRIQGVTCNLNQNYSRYSIPTLLGQWLPRVTLDACDPCDHLIRTEWCQDKNFKKGGLKEQTLWKILEWEPKSYKRLLCRVRQVRVIHRVRQVCVIRRVCLVHFCVGMILSERQTRELTDHCAIQDEAFIAWGNFRSRKFNYEWQSKNTQRCQQQQKPVNQFSSPS